jgi:hypothetical protein
MPTTTIAIVMPKEYRFNILKLCYYEILMACVENH